jgi:hypothetical protein
MKVIRVPWIRCRADEIDARPHEMEWRRQSFSVLAYTEHEAREWWEGLEDAERGQLLGMVAVDSTDQGALF